MQRLVLCPIVAALALAQAAPVPAQITAADVRRTIDDGVKRLQSRQQEDGSWREYSGKSMLGGATALCTLALLHAGVAPSDPSIQKALAYLRAIPPEKTYCVALQTMVFARAEPETDRGLIQRNVQWLQRAQFASGTWTYQMIPFDPRDVAAAAQMAPDFFRRIRLGDNSNSQFALLGLYEAARAGVWADEQTWRLAARYWQATQNQDGSWGYKPGNSGTASMTAAGVASLVIASDVLFTGDAYVAGDRIVCCGRKRAERLPAAERALQWLGRQFNVKGKVSLYYLYGIERVGRLTGQRFLGSHDWYREAADLLLRKKDEGDWSEYSEDIGASFALLFLSKGRWPVLMGKLKHGQELDWNQHRSDVMNLVRYAELRWKRDMVWQEVDLDPAGVEDLLESPVLYYCGRNNPLPQTPAAQQELARRLRDYLDRGGFLFAEAYCGDQAFDQGFQQLMQLAFPEPEYRLRLLPAEHPIWRAEEKVEPDQVRPLLGIESGCRTAVVYAPPDQTVHRPSLSCLWELSRRARGEKFSAAVQRQVQAGMSIGLNVLAYATNRDLKFKDAAFRAPEDPLSIPAVRGRIHIASLRHPGGCDAAPRALTNLMRTAADELGVRTSTDQHELDITDAAIFDYHLVFMHGRSAFRLTKAEQDQLRTYVERGGMIFANSLCSSQAFTESFRREVQAIFPGRTLQPVGAGDPLWTRAFGGFDLKTVTRRDPQAPKPGEPFQDVLHQVPPELEGVKSGDRYGVLFSRYDLSCALERQDSVTCQGYVREDAGRIGLNVLLYSLQR